MIFKIPVEWSMCGIVEIEADSLEDAKVKVIEDEDILLPDCGEYISDSWQLNDDDLFIEFLNKQEDNKE